MRINPDVELRAEGFADLRHIQHADWGAVQVADSAGDVVAMVLVLSGCLVGLAVGVLMVAPLIMFVLNAKGRPSPVPLRAPDEGQHLLIEDKK